MSTRVQIPLPASAFLETRKPGERRSAPLQSNGTANAHMLIWAFPNPAPCIATVSAVASAKHCTRLRRGRAKQFLVQLFHKKVRSQTPSPASSFFARQKTWEKNDPHRCKATGQRFYGTTCYMLFSTLKCETNCGYRPFDNARIEERVPRIKPSGMLNN